MFALDLQTKIVGILIVLSAVVVLFGGTYYAGVTNERAKWEEKVAQQKAQIEVLQQKQALVTVVTETKYVDRIKTVKEKGDVIIQEVPVYITKEAESKCVVPDGFRMLHDTAATGVNSNPTTEPDAPAGVSLADVTKTVTSNYTTCRAQAEQLKGLQEWVNKQVQLGNSPKTNP